MIELWEALAAIGTLAAVGASVTFGVVEGFRARRDREELVALRRVSEEKERIAAASLVTVWVTENYTPSPKNQTYVRTVTLHVANEPNEPVVNATVEVHLSGSRMIGPLAAPYPVPVLPPRREFHWDITAGVSAHEHSDSPLAGLGFTDAQGRRWYRRPDGTLSESTGKDVFHYASEDPDTAEAQLGEINPWTNPMSIAWSFAAALWAEPSDFDLDAFKVLLDPLAEGWISGWSDDTVPSLRELLSGFNNLAAHAWYASPRVAYARLFSSEALGQVTKAGTSLAVNGIIITLVHRGDVGWKVFGVGSRYRPDQIHFPDFEKADSAAPA